MGETNESSGHGGKGASRPVVCFLGPISSYTHQATMKTFPVDQFDLMPVTTIKDVFDITQSGATTYGVVPFENSSNGSVVFTLDYFADRSNEYADLNVCREIYFDVHHCLLGHIAPSSPPPLSSSSSTIPASSTTILTPKSNEKDANKEEEEEEKGSTRSRSLHPLSHVRRVYSHPQAFGQCAAFLGSWLKGIETIDVSSTSRAAELALADASGESAAISSAVAAELLGLDVLARNIEDRDDNTTRFFVLRKGTTIPASPSAEQEQEQEQGEQGEKETTKPNNEKVKPEEEEDDDAPLLSSTKSLLSFTVPHRSPGALADVLSCFRRGGLNLTSINNRPSHAGPFEYVFFVEFEGHRFRDPRGRVAGVLRDVANLARTWRWLGSWESMRKGGAMAVVR